MFDREIAVSVGEIVERDRFVFADVLPVETAERAETANAFSESRIQNTEFRRRRSDDPNSSTNPAAF
jgi:hypothetical protein